MQSVHRDGRARKERSAGPDRKVALTSGDTQATPPVAQRVVIPAGFCTASGEIDRVRRLHRSPRLFT